MRLLKHINNRLGFSLVEVLLAVALIGILAIPISMLFTISVEKNDDVGKRTHAYSIAADYMERIKANPLVINENIAEVIDLSIPIGDDWMEVPSGDSDYCAYIIITENADPLPQYSDIKSLKVKIKVTSKNIERILVELISDVSVLGS
jgi:prepilin-type N-terminal cleavage/methylation domain-containing protein